jgi:methyltransferase (TIGR00027 family)
VKDRSSDHSAGRQPSRTAAGVAYLRAVHQHLDGDPKVLDDPVAVRLLHPQTTSWMDERADELRASSVGLRCHVVARSRYAEDRLEAAVARGVRQYVVLGAGLDTFAYRQPAWATSTRIFEVDHPASQRDKRDRVDRAGLDVPDNLVWAAVDLTHTPLGDGLRAHGFEAGQPAFVACLGVFPYLTEDEVDAVLGFVAGLPAGSEIVFTFTDSRDAQNHAGVPDLAARVASLGEPFRSTLTEEDLPRRLAAAGFAAVDIPTAEQVHDRYFAGRSDGLEGPRRARIASAQV